ncbi:Acetyltransferase, GNAT family [Pseudomonas amygdali pv. mori]|uniref:Acetyltransferase, GNAT family n=1 Tax=Pseudomonas amygdali pv. mori TaxID=34065 RepID=A0A3M5J249_PSEA0|nr:Acetyltransferase, GNAT family [Pseudomonas amygdali pv. mori]
MLPKFMGQGIGKKMVTHLEHLARKAGVAKIHLEATLNAENCYQRCGFTASAQAIYNSPSEHQLACVPMRKQLVDHTDLKDLECRALR